MPKVFSTDVVLYATLYVVADDLADAKKMAEQFTTTSIEFSDRLQMIGEDLYMTGESFSPDMPPMSLSPAMTPAPMTEQAASISMLEEMEDFSDD